MATTIVFYDGGCGLCAAEIRHYAHLDRAGAIEWVDISRDQVLLNALGVTCDQAMQRLHVLDRNGLLCDGVCAFLAIWTVLPYYHLLARVVRSTRMIPVLEQVYQPFAAWRYRRRMKSKVCNISVSPSFAGNYLSAGEHRAMPQRVPARIDQG